MIDNPSQNILPDQLLQNVLGQSLTDPEQRQLLRRVKFFQPKPWHLVTSRHGVYFIADGRVRIVDGKNNLLTSLSSGETYGEASVLPEALQVSYSVRTTQKGATICFIPEAALQPLLERYPAIRAHLIHRVEQFNLRLLRPHPTVQERAIQLTSAIPSPQLQSEHHPNRKKWIEFPKPSSRIGHLWQHLSRRYPFIAQHGGSDCGAACLAMIARYWGKHFSINHLRSLINVDRNGASLRGLVSGAEALGFSARPVKAQFQALTDLQLPAIAHWEGKHYIVVYAINSQWVIVADPAIGQRRLTHAAFQKDWTGFLLLLQPTLQFGNATEEKTHSYSFTELVKPHWTILLEVAVASILIQIFGLVTPLFTQLLLDRVVVQGSLITLHTVGIGLLLFGLFRVALTGFRQYLLDHTANKIDLALVAGFIQQTFRLPLNFFETRYVGDIISRIQENKKIQRFLTGEAVSVLLDLLTVFIYMGLMFWYSWKLALLTLVILPPTMLIALLAMPFLQKISREIFKTSSEEIGYLIQALTGARTVKSMAVEQSVRWHWESLLDRSLKKNFTGQLLSNSLQISSAVIETSVTAGLLWLGGWLVIRQELTIGQLVAFSMLLGNVMTPFRRLSVLWNELQEVVIAVERINDIMETEPEESKQYVGQALPLLRGHIQLEQVTFRYHPDNDRNTLENLTFEVLPGQMVALVGRSGSGKTTLSKLLLGLYYPTEGRILIDGYDISSLSLRSLRQQVGVVDQDSFLFSGTIRANIALAYPEATLDEIIQAAELAGAHAFIQELPQGYESEIGEGGGLLSGGQRQRLAIARALISDPRLLIFDEATSHLDTESERLIQTNLDKILKGRTTFVIAHRLSTVRNADLILVLDRGILVEHGTHDELMMQRGQYFYFNQQQFL
jgi:ATP-binding cassette, subfamily B, bacterial HlyB/CyaB